jgi:hypothetical protein
MTQQLDAADSEVAGAFNGNNQPAKLVFVSAHKGTRGTVAPMSLLGANHLLH